MLVEVLYFADFRDISNLEKENLELSRDFTINGLLKELFSKYPDMKELIWNDASNDLFGLISIAINDKFVDKNNSPTQKLAEGDRVAFLLPMSGG